MAKKSSGELTPMMQQYYQFKAENPSCLILFRCGDFYETYGDDAEKASRILGITLTRRNNGASKGDAMAGFPYHALDVYLPRLVRHGCRVAVCEQLEDPKKTNKLVKRGITELVTPGVAMGDNVLTVKENNFLAALSLGRGAVGVAFLDISTGEFLCGEGTYEYAAKLIDDLQPKEVLYDRTRETDFRQHFQHNLCTYPLDDWMFSLPTAEQRLHRHFGVRNMKGFGVDHLKNGIMAAGAIMHYLDITHHTETRHITSLQRIDTDRYVRLDSFTLRSLEILSPMADDGVSLLSVIDNTQTAMGGRLLRRWMTFPLKDRREIDDRLNTVEYYLRSPEFRETVHEQLRRICDLERIISKVSVNRVNPRELRQLAEALDAINILRTACRETDYAALIAAADKLETCTEMRQRIEREIRPDTPLLIAKGGVIGNGIDQELDELRTLHTDSKHYLMQLQEREAQRTGIQSLKVGYNNVFGYYLEVRNTYRDIVPGEWTRKQTLAQAERYITPELKEYETKILTAETRILEIEQRIYMRLVEDLKTIIPEIQRDAFLIARLDCLLSFAIVSLERRYIRPVIDDTLTIDIRAGRHPVIETQMQPGEDYIPNDIHLDDTTQQIIIITGPNMSGKSALLRQTALITLMAQTGCFVPAERARIGIVDRIFTRVGASDNIAAGESTFMVEMTEAANILNNATSRSLVLFDELGRGTSTYDGISIAWAIVEYLHEKVTPRTLFATHYHELNEMARHFSRIKNFNVSVMETDDKVIFLRKLVEGGSEHSFGIHVAEIAGMPKQITDRAAEILLQLEKDSSSVGDETALRHISAKKDAQTRQMSFFQLDDPILEQIRDTLLHLDVDNLTPLQALNKLNEIKGILGS